MSEARSYSRPIQRSEGNYSALLFWNSCVKKWNDRSHRKTFSMIRMLPYILILLYLSSCEKLSPYKEDKYDLLPLSVGNEFFYNYSCTFYLDVVYLGIERIDSVIVRDVRWTIVSADSIEENNTIQFKFEELFFNGSIEYFDPPLVKDLFEVDTNSIVVTEYLDTNSFTFQGFSFPRFSTENDTINTSKSTLLYKFIRPRLSSTRLLSRY